MGVKETDLTERPEACSAPVDGPSSAVTPASHDPNLPSTSLACLVQQTEPNDKQQTPLVVGPKLTTIESLGESSRQKKNHPRKGKWSQRRIEGNAGEPALYQCDLCPKVYPSLGGIKYHLHVCHSESYAPVVCDLCGKVFRLQKYLNAHKYAVHLKMKDHLCDLCGKGLSSKFGLKLHKMVHAGEKNFPCEVCGKRFNSVGKVNVHRKVHGGPKTYVCEVCSRAFRWKKSLLNHMRTHSGERPFRCEHCGRSFSALWNMQQHVRIHTGVRPYSCETCGKAFILNASLKEHIVKHHPEHSGALKQTTTLSSPHL